jgi:DNA-binding MarR family transcriptional regulator
MSSAADRRADLIERMRRAFGRNSLATELMNTAVAERLGLNLTDFNTLMMLGDRGPMAASQIAEATGLSSGAVTGVIDRLERAGWVVRESDPDDRRRVVVRAAMERKGEVEELFRPLAEAGFAKMADASEEKVEFILGFLTSTAELFEQHAARLAQGRTGGGPEDSTSLSAALGGRRKARLKVKGGAALVTICGGAPAGRLYLAEFEGEPPRLKLDDDTLEIAFSRPRPFERGHRGTLALADGVEWEIQLKGGGARLKLDLSTLSLGALELSGGVSDVTVALPRPEGHRAVRVSGGASQLTVTRPRGVSARLRLSGGAAKVVFDSQRMGAVGGDTRLESDGYAEGEAAWDIEVNGGASTLSVTTA